MGELAIAVPGKLTALAMACFLVCWAGAATGTAWMEVAFGVVGGILYLVALASVALMATGVIDG